MQAAAAVLHHAWKKKPQYTRIKLSEQNSGNKSQINKRFQAEIWFWKLMVHSHFVWTNMD